MITSRSVGILVLALSAVLLCGCMDWGGGPAWDKTDAWYRFPPQAIAQRDDWKELDAARVHLVAEAQEADAENELKDVSFRAISGTRADQLAGEHIAPVPGTRFYLVRSVYLNKYTGAYRVIVGDGNVWVRHGSLGHHAVPMGRQVLILQLSDAPREIFASCSMAG